MASSIGKALNDKSTSEILFIFKKLKAFLKNPEINNAGLGSFQAVLKLLDISATKLELVLVILELDYGQIPIGKRSGERRQEVLIQLAKFESSCPSNDPREKFIYGKGKAKDFLIGLINDICIKWHYDFNSDIDGFYKLSPKNNVERLNFNCYYWYENEERTVREVKTGKLYINCFNPDKKDYKIISAELYVYSTYMDAPIKMVSNEIISNSGIIYTFFKNADEDQIITSININVGRIFPKAWSFITGTYSTVGPGAGIIPIVGLMVLEQFIDENSSQAVQPQTEVSPVIHHYLHRTRLFAVPSIFEDVNALPSFRETELLKKYVGSYAGVYFHKSKAKPHQDRVDHFLFEIASNGEATLRHPQVDEPYKGRVRVLKSKNNALIGYLDFLRKESTYRFTIYFDKEYKGHNKDLLAAVYAGIEREDPYVPTAGRMVFRKLESAIQPKAYSDYIYSDSPISKFVNLPANKQILTLLNGQDQDNDFIETLPIKYGPFKVDNPVDMPFAGTYYSYYLSTMQGKIYKVPIKINTDCSVEMKTRDSNAEKVHKGFAIYNGTDRLSIYIENILHRSSFFHLLFGMSNISKEHSMHFFGVSSKFDKQSSPSGRIEILVKEDYAFDLSISETFVIGSEKFITENNFRNNLLNYLCGRSNRIIVSKTKVNSDFNRANEHQEYFYAACYICKTRESRQDYEKGLRYLYQAYLHGFGEKAVELEIIKREIDDSFSAVINLPLKSRPNNCDLPPMTFKELLDKMIKLQSLFEISGT